MSASAPRNVLSKNPAKKFIKWKGGFDQGFFEHYDKEIVDEKLRNVKVDLSNGFAICDEDLFSITGWDDVNKIQYISNSVREITDRIIVKGYQKGKPTVVFMDGTYEQLKNAIKGCAFLHYTRDVYIAYNHQLCHLALSGTAFAHWLTDVQPNSKHSKSLISHVDNEAGKKGNVQYIAPVFKVGAELSDIEWNEVLELDSILQEYLKEYLARPQSASTATATQDEGSQEIDTSKWREVASPSGIKLGQMTSDQLRELSELMVDDGATECDLYNYVGQGLYDFQIAIKEWESKKDKSGRLLSDYSLAELKEMLAKVPVGHQSRQFLYAGIDAKESAEAQNAPVEVLDDGDDIPF